MQDCLDGAVWSRKSSVIASSFVTVSDYDHTRFTNDWDAMVVPDAVILHWHNESVRQMPLERHGP